MASKHQVKVSLTPFIKGAVEDISSKIGCSKAAYIRMCIKKDADERGYKHNEIKEKK